MWQIVQDIMGLDTAIALEGPLTDPQSGPTYKFNGFRYHDDQLTGRNQSILAGQLAHEQVRAHHYTLFVAYILWISGSQWHTHM